MQIENIFKSDANLYGMGYKSGHGRKHFSLLEVEKKSFADFHASFT